jgi:hypothetical protein
LVRLQRGKDDGPQLRHQRLPPGYLLHRRRVVGNKRGVIRR